MAQFLLQNRSNQGMQGFDYEIVTPAKVGGRSSGRACKPSGGFFYFEVVMVGEKFGRLLVLELSGKNNRSDRLYLCLCDCGEKTNVRGADLRRVVSATKSCGCLRRELARTKATKTHGMSKSLEFRTWAGMIQRCTNDNSSKFKLYGGRGITVCEEWIGSFETFFADMGPRPFPGAQIDRIDNDLGYFPRNCRWVDSGTNSSNTRRNVIMTYRGVNKTLSQWSKICGVNRSTFNNRKRRGWSDKRIIETPSK